MPRFKPNPAFVRGLPANPQVKRAIESRTVTATALARELAPDDPSTGTPDLKTGIVSKIGLTGRGWVGRIESRNFKGHWHEFGTSRMAAHPYLRPALERLGLRMRGTRP